MIIKSFKMFGQMVIQITREFMMLLLCITPILIGMVFRFGIPLIERYLCHMFERPEILVPYYFMFDWVLAIATGMLFAFVGGLVALGEIDDRIATYIGVTPAGKMGFVLSRIGYPAMISGIITTLIVPLFALEKIEVPTLMLMVASTMLSGVVTVMLVIAISSNKVEGMAVGKLSGGFGILFIIPFLVTSKMQYIMAPFPMFWIGKYIIEKKNIYLFIAFVLFAVWIRMLYIRFSRKLCR